MNALAKESTSLRRASRDPAVTLLLLAPLALLHLLGSAGPRSGAYSLVEQFLTLLGPVTAPLLWALLFGAIVWSLGRLRTEALPWRGGAALAAGEGIAYGLLLGPVVRWFIGTLGIVGEDATLGALDSLGLACGAGLYEELLFRGVLMGGLMVGFQALLYAAGFGKATRTAWVLALVASSAMFAFAHAIGGSPSALLPVVLVYRFLAGGLLGVLFTARGLAVAAYAHATYDAILLV